MPAETHQLREGVGVDDVLEVLASVLGVEHGHAGSAPLAELGADDDLAIIHLWGSVVEELGERATGELDLDDRPVTLRDLAVAFHRCLG